MARVVISFSSGTPPLSLATPSTPRWPYWHLNLPPTSISATGLYPHIVVMWSKIYLIGIVVQFHKAATQGHTGVTSLQIKGSMKGEQELMTRSSKISTESIGLVFSKLLDKLM